MIDNQWLRVQNGRMTNTTVERAGSTLTITTTVDLPTSPTFPIAIPTSDPLNTAAAVADLYERAEG